MPDIKSVHGIASASVTLLLDVIRIVDGKRLATEQIEIANVAGAEPHAGRGRSPENRHELDRFIKKRDQDGVSEGTIDGKAKAIRSAWSERYLQHKMSSESTVKRGLREFGAAETS